MRPPPVIWTFAALLAGCGARTGLLVGRSASDAGRAMRDVAIPDVPAADVSLADVQSDEPPPPREGPIVQLGVGEDHGCALLQHGSVWCWDYNSMGQLGDGTFSYSRTPVWSRGTRTARVLSAGSFHTCAVLTDGRVQCWGDNDSGQIGDGDGQNVSTPVDVVGISDATSVIACDGWTCALHADRRVSCWGSDVSGNLGLGRLAPEDCPFAEVSGPCAHTPQRVPSLADVAGIACGRANTCAWTTNGTVYCWGETAQGVAPADPSDSSCVQGLSCTRTPRIVHLEGAVRMIGVSTRMGAALLVDGRITEWGQGAGTDLMLSMPADTLVVGDTVVCPLLQDGSLTWPCPTMQRGVVALGAGFENMCWALNFGEIWCRSRGTEYRVPF